MTITVNGKEKTVGADNPTVLELLQLENVKAPEMVSVQLNGKILRRDDVKTTPVNEGDELEFLYFMGGGS